MGQFYNIVSADKAGTWRSKFAKGDGDDMQDWFLTVSGVDKTVKTTTKIDESGQTRTPSGQTYGSMETVVARSSGNEYFKFKRQQPPEGMEAPAPQQQAMTPVGDHLEERVKRLEEKVFGEQEEVLSDEEEDQISPDEIPF